MFPCKSFSLSFVLIFCAALLFQLGCSNKKSISDHYSTNIKKVHLFYTLYMDNHEMTGPKEESELKDFLVNDPTAAFIIKRVGVTPENLDDFFVSERDGEPFIIKYGLKGRAEHAIVFEKTGVDGMRLVAFGKPRALDEEEYMSHFEGKIEPTSESTTDPSDLE